MAPRTDVDLLRQATERNTEKLDKLLNDLPLLYQDRQSYERRHEVLEHRVDVLENRVQANAEKVDELYRTGKDWANETFADVMKQFTDESKAIRKEIGDLRTSLYGVIIGSVSLPIFFIVLAHYVWR
jgi:hypothetical protein